MAPTLFFIALSLAATPAAAQTQTSAAQPAPRAPAQLAPDAATMSKLIWSIMAAIDHANATGNYSVLRDLGAPSFQATNTAASLAGTFQHLRNGRVDLSQLLLSVPNYDIPPTIVEGGLLRVRGVFPTRPDAIAFDLLFQPVANRWALFGVAVAPVAPLAPTRPR